MGTRSKFHNEDSQIQRATVHELVSGILAPLVEGTLHWAVRRLCLLDLLSFLYFISLNLSAHLLSTVGTHL